MNAGRWRFYQCFQVGLKYYWILKTNFSYLFYSLAFLKLVFKKSLSNFILHDCSLSTCSTFGCRLCNFSRRWHVPTRWSNPIWLSENAASPGCLCFQFGLSVSYLISHHFYVFFRLWYQEIVGGALVMNMHDYLAINGYSNLYFGWGGVSLIFKNHLFIFLLGRWRHGEEDIVPEHYYWTPARLRSLLNVKTPEEEADGSQIDLQIAWFGRNALGARWSKWNGTMDCDER